MYPFLLGPPSNSTHPSHPSRSSRNTRLSSCGCRLSLAVCFTLCSIYMSVVLSQFIPPYPSPTVSTCLCLYSSLGNRLICTIFLDSTYMHKSEREKQISVTHIWGVSTFLILPFLALYFVNPYTEHCIIRHFISELIHWMQWIIIHCNVLHFNQTRVGWTIVGRAFRQACL